MRRSGSAFLLSTLILLGAPARGALPAEDEAALRALSHDYVAGWLANDRDAVMGPLAPEAVFIPHDGVKPKIGYQAIDAFWFPNGKAVGVVPAMTHTITAISGTGNHATLYGRSDLVWENSSQRYHWVGNFLIVARKNKGRWLMTHMMSSDEQPTVTDIEVSKPVAGAKSQ